MVMQLDKVVPFGRCLDEYRCMFALSDGDLDKTIVGIGDGPASFNAEMYADGRIVCSVDPIYEFGIEQIQRQFYAVVEDIIDQVRATPDDWCWSYHKSPDKLRQLRETVMLRFAADFPNGNEQGRYRAGELPRLEFEDRRFDLALCSHLLFLYSRHLDFQFHLDSIREMLRIAEEVRIFPLLTLDLQRSPYLEGICQVLSDEGYTVRVVKVDYEMQRGANQMLVLQRSASMAALPIAD